jgi:hypothetical protein
VANQGLHYCTINTTVLCVTRPPIALHKKAASRYRVMRALGGILRPPRDRQPRLLERGADLTLRTPATVTG